MFIVFKQIFKTFLRNGLLIFSLFLVIATIFLMGSSSLQLSLSINNSIEKVTTEGNAAKVISNDMSSVGNIVFKPTSFEPLKESKKVWTNQFQHLNRNPEIKADTAEYNSSNSYKLDDTVWSYDTTKGLYLWYKSLTDGNNNHPLTDNTYWEEIPQYKPFENTTLPLGKDDLFYTIDGVENYSVRQSVANKKFFGGVETTSTSVGQNFDDWKSWYKIYDVPTTEYGYPFWKTNKTIDSSIVFAGEYQGLIHSFVDRSKDNHWQVLSNPNSMIYNAQGVPVLSFSKGSLTNSIALNEGIGTLAEKYKNTPYNYAGPSNNDTSLFLKRCSSADPLHNTICTPNVLPGCNGFLFYRYKEVKQLPTYSFEIDWGQTSESVKDFIKNLSSRGIDIVKDAFDNVFNVLKVSPLQEGFDELKPEEKALGAESNLSYDSATQKIYFAIADDTFLDLNDPHSYDPAFRDKLLMDNKKQYLNVFANYLSNEISQRINLMFNDIFQKLLKDKGIYLTKNKEYLYADQSEANDLLFVEKAYRQSDVFANNKIVLTEGTNIDQNPLGSLLRDKSYFEPTIDYFEGYQDLLKKTYYAIQNYMNSTSPSDPIYTDYKRLIKLLPLLYYLVSEILFETYHSPTPIVNNMIPDDVLNTKYYKYAYNVFSGVWSSFSFLLSGSYINFSYNLDSYFTTINVTKDLLFLNPDNTFVVVSTDFASKNNKRSLPLTMSSDLQNRWVNALNGSMDDFKIFIDGIKNTSDMYLSKDFIKWNFNDTPKYEYWLKNLSSNVIISYKGTKFLICGLGVSPDYAFPIVNITSPVPNPDNQGIVYVNQSIFNSLGINDVDTSSYLSYGSNTLSPSQIINTSQDVYRSLLSADSTLPIYNVKDAKAMGIVYMRSAFPQELRNFIVYASLIIILFLLILAFVIIFLLIKSITNNLIRPLAIVLSNGFSLSNIILSCVGNVSVIAIIAAALAYVISYLLQGSLLSIFTPLIFVPIATLPFNLGIYFGLVGLALLFTGGIFAAIIANKFKSSITEILNKQDSPKNSKAANWLMSLNIKSPMLPKVSLGFSTTLIGRLSLIAILGSLSLGIVVSSATIKEKFVVSQTLTADSRKYNNDINLANIKEQTGLYKPQPYEELGFTDNNVGITPIYPIQDIKDPNYAGAGYDFSTDNIPDIYNKANLRVLTVDPSNPHNLIPKLYNNEMKSLTNLILPSFSIYQSLTSGAPDILFNASASLIALNFKIKIPVGEINIWDQIKIYFPEWIVYQFEHQILDFKQAAMEKYGEMYSYFLVAQEFAHNTSTLSIPNVDDNSYGYYYPVIKDGRKSYEGNPIFVWKNDTQKFKREDAIVSQVVTPGSSLSFNLNDYLPQLQFKILKERTIAYDPNQPSSTYPSATECLGTLDEATVQQKIKNNQVLWKFVPAYQKDYEFDRTKATNDQDVGVDFYKISLKTNILKLFGLFFGDPELSKKDARVSCGIVPVGDTEETYTNINAQIDGLYNLFNKKYQPQKNIINIMGIDVQPQKQPQLVVLKNRAGNDISSLISDDTLDLKNITNETAIPVIVNEGAALEWGLSTGSEIDISVLNNMLSNSYNVLNQIIHMDNNPLNNHYKLVVKGISTDSLGEKIYMNQKVANTLIGIDQAKVINHMNPKTATIHTLDKELPFVPFNSILSSNPQNIIGTSIIPFYSNSGLWTFATDVNALEHLNIPLITNLIVTRDRKILNELAKALNIPYDASVSDESLRSQVIVKATPLISGSSYKQALKVAQGPYALLVAAQNIMPTAITNEIFTIMSNLITAVITILIAIIIPLLVVVIFITSFSMIEDLFKRIALMKVMGLNGNEISRVLSMMYIPIILVVALLGVGLMFGMIYGLQFIVYNATSIFISETVSAGFFGMGFGVILLILALSIVFMYAKLKRKEIANAVKF